LPVRRIPLPVAEIWENALPGDSGREVLTDAGEVTTDGVGGPTTDGVPGPITGVEGTVELGGGIGSGDTAFAVTGPGPVDGVAAGREVAPRAAATMAARVTNPTKR
jgi:hypothetical protein